MTRRRHWIAGGLCVAALVACVPKLTPLTGSVAPSAALPHTGAPLGHHQVVFTWEYQDRDMNGRGDGVARIAAPDSARLDFFLGGGFGGGAAILIGDSLQLPGGVDLVQRLVPPPPLLWAALGRVALPSLADTVIRVEAGVLRADVGRPVAWRLSFRGDTLVRAEHVDGGKVLEWMERTDSAHVRYHSETARRSLDLTITRTDVVPDFDASIWRFSR
ncbi:MAG TPA: hypothetical protein VGM67_21205 [Gemmatimonadaceae bacterium]|jgi:hypothetical protein